MKESSISGKVFVPKDADCPIRRLRYVLVDAGDELQAFNAVIYPAHGLGPLPVLGIDVLSFNSHKKLLFGVDWAPMTPGEAYSEANIAPYVSAIRQQHDAIRLDPTGKFYGELPEFFSPHMFFSRPEGQEAFHPGSELWDVFRGYAERYSAMIRSAPRGSAEEARAKERQTAYDIWHAARDPALPVFKRMFGEPWTEEYARVVLFPGVAEAPDGPVAEVS